MMVDITVMMSDITFLMGGLPVMMDDVTFMMDDIPCMMGSIPVSTEIIFKLWAKLHGPQCNKFYIDTSFIVTASNHRPDKRLHELMSGYYRVKGSYSRVKGQGQVVIKV